MSLLRTYQGTQDYRDSLKSLLPLFVEAYQKSISSFSNKTFITFIDSKGNKTVKSFLEFDRDVKSTIGYLRKEVPAGVTVCIASENSYHFAKFIVAVLLEGIPLCVMNPDDGSERIKKKLQVFNENYFFICSKKYQLDFKKVFPKVFCIDEQIPDSIVEIKRPAKNLDEPFILVFTSGSTGYAKTV